MGPRQGKEFWYSGSVLNSALNTKLHFFKSLQEQEKSAKTTIVIFDRYLLKIPQIALYLKTIKFKIPVTAGENLKTLKSLEACLAKIQTMTGATPKNNLAFVSLGGGSVGDFTGFAASIYKRGVQLIHIPTTWLAAIDSAHGGKNALNFENSKNQLGTVYFPTDVFLIQNILEAQPKARGSEAWGEIAKMGIVDKSLQSEIRTLAHTKKIWPLLPRLIESKMKTVKADPYESKGKRKELNLGHTYGHVLEAEFKIPHGLAIGEGLLFALFLSLEMKMLSMAKAIEISNYLSDCGIRNMNFQISTKSAKKYFLRDKKNETRENVQFVLIKDFGNLKVVDIPISEVLLALKKFGGF